MSSTVVDTVSFYYCGFVLLIITCMAFFYLFPHIIKLHPASFCKSAILAVVILCLTS